MTILENKKRYFELLSSLNVDLSAFYKYLESDRADFFNKPYSIYMDKAYAGSLCEHSLQLYDELKKIISIYAPDKYSEEDIVKVTLLKDLYRAELYEPYYKNVKNETTGQWEVQLSYRTKEERPVFGDINFSSYMIAKKFIPLDNDEVVEAICYSNPGNLSMIDSFNLHKTYKLLTYTTMAEIATLYLN